MSNIKKFDDMNENEEIKKIDSFIEKNFHFKILNTKRLNNGMTGRLSGFDDIFKGYKRRGFNPYVLNKEEVLVPMESSIDYSSAKSSDSRVYFLNEEEHKILKPLFDTFKEVKENYRKILELRDKQLFAIVHEIGRRTKDGEPLRGKPLDDIPGEVTYD